MNESTIEAMLASPPERDELVVQLFAKEGGQWAEIFREGNRYWVDLYLSPTNTMTFELDLFVDAITRAQRELAERLRG